MSTVMVASVVATKYRNGGNACAVLNWVHGLRQLGLRTYFVEQIAPEHCVDADGRVVPFERSATVAYFNDVMRAAGLTDRSSLICGDGQQTAGMPYREVLEAAGASDLLLNISGHLTLEPVLRRLRRKAYLDLDPGYTQFWHASGDAGARVYGHDCHFTIGENIGTPGCAIPTGDIRWRHTRQPIVLPSGTADGSPWTGRFTTVGSWRGSYGPIRDGSRTFGLKVHEFRKFIELPARSDATFEIALDIHPADARDLEALRGNGWRVVDPRGRVPDPRSFDDYIAGSDGEWSAAQGIYVETNSGWFSDRTVRYLAAGKPAIVQDTGFTRILPSGDGLIAFRTLDEAARAVDTIQRDPHRHQRAARALAAQYFDSNDVIGRLLDDAGVAA